MRVVIDTNCFLAIIPKVSPFRQIFDAFRTNQFELAVSTDILDEYAEIFSQRMTPAIADNLLELIDKQTNTTKTEIYYRWGMITGDYDDNKFVVRCVGNTGISGSNLHQFSQVYGVAWHIKKRLGPGTIISIAAQKILTELMATDSPMPKPGVV